MAAAHKPMRAIQHDSGLREAKAAEPPPGD
jgi:hypothetical protein